MPQVSTMPPARRASRTTILRDEVPAPPPITENLAPESPDEAFNLWQWMRDLSERDWEKYIVYLYWLPPGARKTGPYIQKVAEPIDLEWVKQRYGGSGDGIFKIVAEGPDKFIKSLNFEIEGTRKHPDGSAPPPVLAAGNGNGSELVALLRDELAKRSDLHVQEAIKAVLEMQRSAFQNTLETVSKSTGGNNLLETITALKTLGLIGAPAAPPQPSILDTIRALKELGLIGTVATAADPLKQVEMVSKLMEAASNLRPEEGGSVGTAIVRAISDGLPHVRNMTADIARAAEFNARAAVATSSQGSGPAIDRTSQNPSTYSSPLSPQNPQTPPPGEQANPASRDASAEQEPATVPFNFEVFLWNRVRQMIAHNMDGDQIAQWIHITAPEVLPQLAGLGEEGLLALLEANAEIKAALEGKDARKLVNHFLHFCATGELVDEDEEDEPEPQAPAIV